MKIDDYLFDPCGYSMNGILKNESIDFGLVKIPFNLWYFITNQNLLLISFQGEYMTIHITPEPEFSYVSFESNIPLTSYLGVIQRVLDTFLPGKFILTIFANRVSACIKSSHPFQWQYSRNDLLYNFCNITKDSPHPIAICKSAIEWRNMLFVTTPA